MNQSIRANALSTRREELLTDMLNVGKDINYSCGYPKFITTSNYKDLFDREGIAKRVVNLFPEESWAIQPEVHQDEKSEVTEFEQQWINLQKKFQIYHYLQRVDILSGVGRYGILLIGLSDGLALSEPVASIDEKTGEKKGDASLEILYLRPFDENSVMVQEEEKDPSSPRFGFPTKYSIQFDQSSQLSGTYDTKTVHWTRILHVADNREVSEVYGVPRMKPVYNRLLDIRKVLSGSGEMFWKGAFPGYSFEINPNIKNASLDSTSIREEFENYSSGLQRYLAIEGVSAKSLQPQVSDPTSHLTAQLQFIAIALGVPLRIFMGSEQAKLASTQDKETWNDRVSNRQNHYVTPMLLEPAIDRLIACGVLPEVVYTINWPDLNSPTDEDKAQVGTTRTEALAKYVAGGVDSLIAPAEFLTIILGMGEEEVKIIETGALRVVPDEPEPDLGDMEEEDV